MDGLFNDNNVWCTQKDLVESITLRYCSDIFTSNNPQDVQSVLQVVEPIISYVDNNFLM